MRQSPNVCKQPLGSLLAGIDNLVGYVHSHKNNEEIYAILTGKGKAVIDGETIELTARDWIRISPSAKHQFFVSENTAIRFVCIQVKEN